MCLVEDDPVRTTGPVPGGRDLGQGGPQVRRRVLLGDGREVDDDASEAMLHEPHHLIGRREVPGPAQYEHAAQLPQADVVTLGVHDQNGVPETDQPLGDEPGEVRLPAVGRAGHQGWCAKRRP